MFTADQYELLDFGQGRKLEKVGPYLLDRISPASEDAFCSDIQLWKASDAVYHRTGKQSGSWKIINSLPKNWSIRHRSIEFEIKPTEFGHLGIFPEQAENWDWLIKVISEPAKPLNVLNLFAYTGGSTLAAALGGASVTHVDAAKSVVQWARHNASLSDLEQAPIRWITEDARKFVQRELKRGNFYDGVILDPPTYGHGAGKQVWKIEDHLEPLLEDLKELTKGSPKIFLLTCHSPGYGAKQLKKLVIKHFPQIDREAWEAKSLFLCTKDDRKLPSGFVCRMNQNNR